jgi:hypothetical protein
MHAFNFSPLLWIAGAAAAVLLVAVLLLVLAVPRIKGMGAIGLGWLLLLAAVCAAVVAIIAGGAYAWLTF